MDENADPWRDRMENKLDRIVEQLSNLPNIEHRLSEHHERLFGNGQPGLIKDVDRLKQDHRRTTRIWPMLLLAVAAAGSAAPEVLHSLLKAFFS